MVEELVISTLLMLIKYTLLKKMKRGPAYTQV